MVTIAIIGDGFIGKHLKCNIEEPYDFYSKKNIKEIERKNYDIVYCAGLYSNINKNSDDDLENIFTLQDCLSSAKINKFILISTIDIYDSKFPNQDENQYNISIDSYGKNRYFMEEWVLEEYKDCHIIRLPLLFGLGLKKNIIYDILNNNRLENINFNTLYQWYCLEELMYDIKKIIKKKIRIVNLISEPIETKNLISICFPEFVIPMFDNNKRIEYNYKSKWFKSGYAVEKKKIVEELLKYINIFKIIESTDIDKLVVSNMSWNTRNDITCIEYLKLLNIRWINLTISKYIDLERDSKTSIQQLYKKWSEYGIKIWSINNLYYNLNLNIFVERQEFTDHFKKMIDYGIVMNAKILVYDCPHSRLLPKNMNKHTANFIFKDVIKFLCEYIELQGSDIIIALNPCSSIYKCNYINTISEAIMIIDQIDNKHFRLNCDTGTLLANNELKSLSNQSIQDNYIVYTYLSLPYYRELISIDSYDDIIYKSFQNPGKISLEIDNCTDFKKNIIKFISLSHESFTL